MTTALEKAKQGRKPLADGYGKTARIQLKLLPAVKVQWVAWATGAGLTLQAWIEKQCNAKR